MEFVHASSFSISFLIAGCRLDKELGRDGFGAVYRAVRETDGSRVALKVLLPRTAAQKKAVEQFLREMDVTAKLKHPDIVHLFDIGHEGGLFFFAMEYCEGGSVADFMRQQGGKLALVPGAHTRGDLGPPH